jgi:hypothetical protein
VLVSDRRRPCSPPWWIASNWPILPAPPWKRGWTACFAWWAAGAAQRRQRQAGVGQLEQSNVNPSVLTQMIQAQRLFDIRTKLIATAKEVDQSAPRCCACLPRNRRFRPLCPFF